MSFSAVLKNPHSPLFICVFTYKWKGENVFVVVVVVVTAIIAATAATTDGGEVVSSSLWHPSRV
jgi:hypothetical protein